MMNKYILKIRIITNYELNKLLIPNSNHNKIYLLFSTMLY